MFEKIGYKKYEKHNDDGDYIEYYSEEEHDSITFYCDSKTFIIGEHCLCNVRVLQAINKQVKELNWID